MSDKLMVPNLGVWDINSFNYDLGDNLKTYEFCPKETCKITFRGTFHVAPVPILLDQIGVLKFYITDDDVLRFKVIGIEDDGAWSVRAWTYDDDKEHNDKQLQRLGSGRIF